jgi:hypothetical protein
MLSSIHAEVLPFLGYSHIAEPINFAIRPPLSSDPDGPDNDTVARMKMGLFLCPADRPATSQTPPQRYPTNYFCNFWSGVLRNGWDGPFDVHRTVTMSKFLTLDTWYNHLFPPNTPSCFNGGSPQEAGLNASSLHPTTEWPWSMVVFKSFPIRSIGMCGLSWVRCAPIITSPISPRVQSNHGCAFDTLWEPAGG